MEERDETKSMTIEERMAVLKERIGTIKIDKEYVLRGLPEGAYIFNEVASDENIRRWAIGIGDLNPRFLSAEYSKKTKYGRLAAPPLFLQSVCFVGVGLQETENVGARGFHSGSDWEFFQPVLEGDRLDFDGHGVIDAEVRDSKFSGKMIVTTGIVQYRNQRGENVGMCKGYIHRSAGDETAINIGKYTDVAKPYRYTDDEIKKIEDDQSKEEMRGDRPRYWEDVKEGDPVGPLVIGPHTIMDSVGHFTAVWGCFPLGTPNRFYRLCFKNRQDKMAQRGIRPVIGVYDPRINAYVNGDLPHLDYDLGRLVGAPGAYDNGGGRECIASILFTNWIGDDGFLWKYSIQFRKFVVHGDTNWFEGRVTRKYIDDGKCCVDVEHWANNQRGERTTTGKATVILPSRTQGQVKYPTPVNIEDIFPSKK